MKAISPIIATIILIGIVIMIGAIISGWITQWVTRETHEITTGCTMNTNYVIDSAKLNESGDDKLVLKITNKNTEKIHTFSIELLNHTDILLFNESDIEVDLSPNITEANPLEEEQSVYIKINLSNYKVMGKSLTEIRVMNKACPEVSAKTKLIDKYG
jgi:flagellin-like protein